MGLHGVFVPEVTFLKFILQVATGIKIKDFKHAFASVSINVPLS